VIGNGGQDNLVGFNGFVDAALLDEALGLFQLFDNVNAHAGSTRTVSLIENGGRGHEKRSGPRQNLTIYRSGLACQTDRGRAAQFGNRLMGRR
jgi:hypothetical protein